MRLLNQWDQLRLEELKLEIAKGIDSLNRGEGTPLDVEAIKAIATETTDAADDDLNNFSPGRQTRARNPDLKSLA